MTILKNNNHKGRKVKVYFNLNKKTFSIVARTGKEAGRVLFYSNLVSLEDCKFRVQQSGRRRVLKEGVKNVHAFAYGVIKHINSWDITNKINKGQHIKYNPYLYSTFVYNKDESVADYSNEILMTVSNNKPSIFEVQDESNL